MDERIISCCSELKDRGYGITLDDFSEFRKDLRPMLDLADIVKVDMAQIDGEGLDELVERLRQFPLRILADKVDSSPCAKHRQDLCFDFFQGYYFDQPSPTVREP